MRDLNNLDEMFSVLVDAEEPVRAILADAETERLWKNGSYLDVLFYLISGHRAEVYGVIAAFDGGITAEEVPAVYSLPKIVALFREVIRNEAVREIFALFSSAGKKTGVTSSGSAPENTGV